MATTAGSTKVQLRKLWFQVHKWIGLTLALPIIVLCLTGSALVWHDWVDETINPQRVVAAAPRQPYFRRPHDGKVLLGWKRRPDGGGHAGIDFAVATGDMIRAAASGTVVAVTEDKERWGKRVVIDHGNGWQSVYGQLARTTVSVGDPIKAGERLGIGGRGKAEAPEFHFEIRRDGRLVDPAPLLRLNG